MRDFVPLEKSPRQTWKRWAERLKELVRMMMPRIFSKAVQPSYSPGEVDCALPVDRATSKAKDHAMEAVAPIVSALQQNIEREASLKLLCDHPDLLPKKMDTDPWCLPILRTEAKLRLSEEYITKTQAFYDIGSMPPWEFDEDVEARALKMHGVDLDHVQSYRQAASNLSLEQRADIFFLRANDRLFRPRADLAGKKLTGIMHRIDEAGAQAVPLEEVLNIPRALVVASTSS